MERYLSTFRIMRMYGKISFNIQNDENVGKDITQHSELEECRERFNSPFRIIRMWGKISLTIQNYENLRKDITQDS